MYQPILDNREVTFVKAQNSNIYQIFRQKVPQNFWNLVIPTRPPFAPFNVKTEAQNRVKPNYLKTVGFRLNLPLLLDHVRKKALFNGFPKQCNANIVYVLGETVILLFALNCTV